MGLGKLLVLASLVLLALSLSAYPLGPGLAQALSPSGPLGGQEDFAIRDVFWASWSGPGAYNTLAIVLEYLSSPEATSITASLDVTPIWPSGGTISDSYDGPLEEGQRAIFYFTFLVPTDARASYYDLPLTVDYVSGGQPRTYGCTIQVSISGLPELSISCDSYELRASSTNHVELRIANEGGGVARALWVQVIPQSPYITVLGPSSFSKDLLEVGAEWPIGLNVSVGPAALSSAYLVVALAYLDQFGSSYTQQVYLGFEIEGEASLAISKVIYMPPLVFPGDRYVALTLILTNVGDVTANNITLRLEPVEGLVEPSYAGAGEAKIPYLPVGHLANITFLLDVDDDARPGYYELPLEVHHDGKNYTLGVPFTIREKASFELTKVELSPKPSPGSRGIKVKVELRNTSNVTAEHVRLSLVSAYITGVTSVLVGDVDGGERRVVILEVDFDESTPLRLELDVQISGTKGVGPS